MLLYSHSPHLNVPPALVQSPVFTMIYHDAHLRTLHIDFTWTWYCLRLQFFGLQCVVGSVSCQWTADLNKDLEKYKSKMKKTFD